VPSEKDHAPRQGNFELAPAFVPGDDMLALDGGCLFVTGPEKHVAHDVFTLASGR
jgi:hypothetical protein